MRLVIFYDKKAEALTKAIEIITKFHIPFNRIEIHVGNHGGYKFNDTCKLFFNERNLFFSTNDKKGIEGLLVIKLYAVLRKMKNKNFKEETIEAIATNREAIKDGFADHVFYVLYVSLLHKKRYVEKFDEFLKINSSWLSFWKLDEFYYETLKRLANTFKIPLYKKYEWDTQLKNLEKRIGELVANNKI